METLWGGGLVHRYAALELEWISLRWLDRLLKVMYLFGLAACGAAEATATGSAVDEEANDAEGSK